MTKTLLDTLTTDENGQATYTYEGDGSGRVSFVAEYDEKSSNTVTVDDYTPEVTAISLIADIYTFNYGGSVTFTATVKDQHNQAMSGQTVTFKNGSTTLGTGTTNSSGIATLTKSDLNAGIYSVTAEISSVSSSAITVSVNKLNTALTLDTPVLVYSDEFLVTGALKDSNGTGIVGATVTLQWNDGTAHTATATTTTGGAVTFSRTAPTAIIQYSFKLVYDASTNYNGTESSQVNVTVQKETSVLNVTSPTSGAAITGSTFSVAGTLKDNDNTAMASKNVLVKLGSTTLDTLTTDSNGDFTGTVSSSGLADGSNTLDFVFAEDTYYTGATQQVTVSKTSFDGISLTSDKSILSKADNESATLSAQLTLNDSPVAISGQSVTFEVRKSSDDSLVETLSGSTNGSGIASVSYLGKGTGDIYIKAECMFLIQTYAVEDCLKYLASYSHTYQGRLTSGTYGTLIYELNSLTDLEITAKVKTSYIYGYAFGLSSNTGNVNVESDWGDYIRMFVGNAGKVGMAYLNNGATDSVTSNYGPSANTFHNWKITYDNGAFKAYHENNLIGTLNTNLPSTSKKIVLQLWNDGKTVTIEDLKVKPL